MKYHLITFRYKERGHDMICNVFSKRGIVENVLSPPIPDATVIFAMEISKEEYEKSVKMSEESRLT